MITREIKISILRNLLFFLFSVPAFGQNEIEMKNKIQSSLENFMSDLSYVNDEDEPRLPSTIASEFGGGNYFVFNGREMKLEHFIEDYCHSDLKRQIVNHTLVLTREGIVKLDSDKADKRWSVNAVLKREYASNPNLKIGDENIKIVVSLKNDNEHISILDIAFQSKPRTYDAANSNPNEDPIDMEVPPSPDDLAAMTNKYPFSARVFVPGMAQLHKGSTGKGIAFIVGEALAVGGVVAFEGLRSSYKAKINTTHDVQDRQNYIDKTNNMQNLRNGFIAGALAVYAWNVIDGIVAKGRKHVELGHVELHFAPFATPEAGGLAMNIQF